MIESSLIEQSYFSNKIDGNKLADILRSQKPSGEMLLNVAQMNQTHSNKIEYIEEEGIFTSDGLITSTKNISLVIQTADCMPVLIQTEASIAALHVGWKGLQNDIFNLALRKITGTNIKVSVGPHAQSCCYEIQNDVAQLFPESVLKRNNKIYLNLSKQITDFCQLNDIQIQVSKNCTVCDNNFWSFRENKTTQRQYSFIWI
ncbi:polyphenol oxidase family protein [Acidimicrobiia bacterium]|jgi:YfiH family protein|nr:polyphenol oxidase family protein [Acidimicrobiia bacterium]MDA7721200.1 polyphenol oxidase family protein [Acidimicrobiaceae bacterium]MDA8923145.1 polyphenol oxidase family protein [Acidimicrobiia bacterium]MDC0866508.1 polyphenol oxidase family protein [Acidimicrobiia bacterium]MDC2961718.1 polyphenol oxidase family protein [Acidimicrobiia bacterium]